MPHNVRLLAPAAIALCALLFCANAQAQTKRAKGWVREPAHIVRALPLMLKFRDYLPEEVDLSAKFPTPGNQGQQSSCTAWATGYAMRSYYEGRRRNWNFSTPGQIISPSYIYNRLHEFRGACDTGTAISDALELLKTSGAPPLSVYPYEENDCTRPANAEQERSGSQFRIRGWSAVDSKRLDDAKGQLARGNPVVFGMDVADSFENFTGGQTYDDVSSARSGGHAMVLVGYSERRQAFKVMNSWGTEWGDGGFGWVSYRTVSRFSDLMFVMDVPDDVVPAPAPAPAPKPAPPIVIAPPEPSPAPKPPVVKPQPAPVPEPPVVVAPPAPSPAPKPPVVIAPPVVKPQPAPVPEPPVVVLPPEPSPVPKPPVVITPPAPPVTTVQAQIDARLRSVSCARLDGKIGVDRVVRVRGFLGAADDLAKLRSEFAAMPGVRRVETGVTVYPWPQCEVYLNFAEVLTVKRGLSATLRGASARAFAGGDSLSIDVVTPAYPSYLYVTYLQAGGDATNLYWPQGRFPKALPPNTKVTLGGGAGGEPVYRIAPPFGDEMVVIVASASPLFADELPDTSTDRDYLTSFRKSFLLAPKGGGGQRVVSAIALPLKTQAK